MRRYITLILILFSSLLCSRAVAQNPGTAGDAIVPISKYMVQANPEALSAWFADNLEISVLSRETNASRAQAKLIVKSFFETYTPRSFEVTHSASRANMKYVLGTMNAGGESFLVTIFVTSKGENCKIQQFKIERTL